METIKQIFDLFMHLDMVKMGEFIHSYGVLVYVLIFGIIFCETGLVVTPFLPGDSLLFAAGALAANGKMSIELVFIVFSLAAIIGDTVNYAIGHALRNKVANSEKIPFVKQEHLVKTHKFFEKHGGKTIIIARFIPIIRTFAPFVAGVGIMPYKKFISYNIIGAVAWVASFLTLGVLFGNQKVVRDHFSLIVVGIISVSIIPIVITFIKTRMDANNIKKAKLAENSNKAQ
jgi:membrane-associated protein